MGGINSGRSRQSRFKCDGRSVDGRGAVKESRPVNCGPRDRGVIEVRRDGTMPSDSSRRNAACRAHLSSISLRSPNRPGTQTPRRSNFSTRRFSNDRVHRVYLDRAAAPNGILCHARHFSLSLCLSLRGYTLKQLA